ncbi:hypothetical protein [Caldinitratiruptor microaerophilus]|uniref:Uncharacterized protein n=1 Tax=Caldinitratiruptor microaerophilus TaxID=671077 RepID=A0AA35CMV9_9FIRM|nr:hypothetical protein [Caldinitratiruptor microaerophilus]BDG60281.1 hypothetical protein caldi_13710 [Caldinitratiruptor microaerophilus]
MAEKPWDVPDRLPVDPGRVLYHHPMIPRARLITLAREHEEATALLLTRDALRQVGYDLLPSWAAPWSWRKDPYRPRVYLRRRCYYIAPAAEVADRRQRLAQRESRAAAQEG